METSSPPGMAASSAVLLSVASVGFAKDDPVSVPELVARTGALIGRIGENRPFVIGMSAHPPSCRHR